MALSSATVRAYLADHPELDLVIPVKAGQNIYAGAACELNGGYLEVVSAAGTFGGFALETSLAVSGEADGDRTVQCRVMGGVELEITTETPAQANVGLSTTFVEATDDNTFHMETGSAITGTKIGNVMRLVTATKVAVSFKAAMVA